MDTQITQRFSKVDLFSTKGRMGRNYYLFYSIVFPFIILGLITILSDDRSLNSTILSKSSLLFGLTVAILSFILFYLTIQRCHDFDKSGWYAIFAFIPFASLIYASIQSTNGLNRYGEIPEPASASMIFINYLVIATLVVITIYLLFGYFF